MKNQLLQVDNLKFDSETDYEHLQKDLAAHQELANEGRINLLYSLRNVRLFP